MKIPTPRYVGEWLVVLAFGFLFVALFVRMILAPLTPDAPPAQAATVVLPAETAAPERLPNGKLNVGPTDIALANCQHEAARWRQLYLEAESQNARLVVALQQHVGPDE